MWWLVALAIALVGASAQNLEYPEALSLSTSVTENFPVPIDPSASGSDSCKTAVANWLTPITTDSSCAEVVLKLSAREFDDICINPCFDRYVEGYEKVYDMACLDKKALTPKKFRGIMCGDSDAPKLDCDDSSARFVNELAINTSCSALTNAISSHSSLHAFCGTPCFAKYLDSYSELWKMNCFAWTPIAMPPQTFLEKTCPTEEVVPVSIAPECISLTYTLLSPFSSTPCRSLLGSSGNHSVACNKECFGGFMDSYRSLHKQGCAKTDPEEYSKHVCKLGLSSVFHPPVDILTRSYVVGMATIPSNTTAAEAFSAFHASAFGTALAVFVGVSADDVLISSVEQGSSSRILVTFEIHTPADTPGASLEDVVTLIRSQLSSPEFIREANSQFTREANYDGPGSEFIGRMSLKTISVQSVHVMTEPVCDSLDDRLEELCVSDTTACYDAKLSLNRTSGASCCETAFAATVTGCGKQARCDESLYEFVTVSCLAPSPSSSSAPAQLPLASPTPEAIDIISTGPSPSVQPVAAESEAAALLPLIPSASPLPIACEPECSANGACSFNGTCQCTAGYSGLRCDDIVPGGPADPPCVGYPFPCSGAGKCHLGKCMCNPGFSGPICNVSLFASCPRGCSDRASACIDGKCMCKEGFAGEDCSIVVGCKEYAFCSGHGICDANNMCACFNGWNGLSCNRGRSCPAGCSGRGECSGFPDYKCTCTPPFGGSSCSRITTSCPNGCSGFGRCDEKTHACKCIKGYTGPDCSAVELPSVCRRCLHAKCVVVEGLARCECEEGWGGQHCDQVTACSHLDFCSGKGACTNNSCACFNGFTGERCDLATPLCGDTFCHGKGRCETLLKLSPNGDGLESEGSCKCIDSYIGRQCEEPTCPSLPISADSNFATLPSHLLCSGHGICDSKHCVCDDGFLGTDCSEGMAHCPDDCSGKGTCIDGVCLCNEGYLGENCAKKSTVVASATAITNDNPEIPTAGPPEPICCPLDCSSNGECKDCVCHCEPDWSGDACNQFTAGDDMA